MYAAGGWAAASSWSATRSTGRRHSVDSWRPGRRHLADDGWQYGRGLLPADQVQAFERLVDEIERVSAVGEAPFGPAASRASGSAAGERPWTIAVSRVRSAASRWRTFVQRVRNQRLSRGGRLGGATQLWGGQAVPGIAWRLARRTVFDRGHNCLVARRASCSSWAERQDGTTSMAPSPYGFWKSPITSDLVVADSTVSNRSRSTPCTLLERDQAQKQGRTFPYRAGADWAPQRVTPDDANAFSVRTRAHEYGGGSFAGERRRGLFLEQSRSAALSPG